MKEQGKNYRIVSERGEVLLIPRKSFECLLETLDAMASGAKRVRSQKQKK